MIEKFSQVQLGKKCEKGKTGDKTYLEAKKKTKKVVYQATSKTERNKISK